MSQTQAQTKPMIDPFGRHVSYLRVSVTDRCDFRCIYCMSEDMQFLPKRHLLSLEELERLCTAFIDKGIEKLRITGGEPLVRRDVMRLMRNLSRHLDSGALKELTLTTNGSQLEKYAADLSALGVKRINVSIDTLDPDKFRKITRRGDLEQVKRGMKAAQAAGIHLKLNAVALKGINDGELSHMVRWCGEEGHDLTFIETMPLGEIDEDRTEHYLPLSEVREALARDFTFIDSTYRTGGPARYVDVQETGQKLGFITPLTHNFCEGCNRVRLTCTGMLYMCLGQEDSADLRAVLRATKDKHILSAAIDEAINRKPKGHDFVIDRTGQAPAVSRHMSVTGG